MVLTPDKAEFLSTAHLLSHIGKIKVEHVFCDNKGVSQCSSLDWCLLESQLSNEDYLKINARTEDLSL